MCRIFTFIIREVSSHVKVLCEIFSHYKKEPHGSSIFSSSARRRMRYSNSFVWLRASFFARSSRSRLSLADNIIEVFFFMAYPPSAGISRPAAACVGLCVAPITPCMQFAQSIAFQICVQTLFKGGNFKVVCGYNCRAVLFVDFFSIVFD